jgi:Tfp pilus assembly protein PilN
MRINLLPKEERPLKQSQVRWEFLVSLVGVLLLGAVLAFSWLETAKIHTLNSALTEARSREAFLQKQVQAVQSLRRDLTALETQEEKYGDLVVEQPLSVLPALTKHPFSQLWIEALVWRDSGVELVGYTQDMTSLSLYLNYLNELSDQALLQAVYPHEGTEFFVFSIEVKGVGGDDPA